MRTARSSAALASVLTGLDEAAQNRLHPGKLGAGVMLAFTSFAMAVVGFMVGGIATIFAHGVFGIGAAILTAIGVASFINKVFSQIAAQTLLTVSFNEDDLSTRTLFATRQIPAKSVNAIYAAPNSRYINLIVDTTSGPLLLCDATWSAGSFALVENGLRCWAKAQNLQVTDVNTVWAKTETDRRAKRLLFLCFRQPYLPTLGILLSIAAVSFLLFPLFKG